MYYNKEAKEIETKNRPGRPTMSPKKITVQVRLDEDSTAILYQYCEENAVTQSEAVRIAIGKLTKDLRNGKE